jgi:uncharacterized LabA/DUF88 family protein
VTIRKNVAVFIDAENLFKGYGKLDIPDVSMEDILKQLESAAALAADGGSIAVARAFADWNALGLEDYRRDVERAGVQTVQVFSVSKAEKNAADIVLVVDCLRVAAELEQIDVFVIVSADGDFVPLVRRLHELNKYVVGATLPDHRPNNVLEREVDQYVTLKLAAKPPPAAALKPLFSSGEQAAPIESRPRKSARKAPAEKPEAPEQPEARTKKAPAKKAAGKKAEPAKKAAGKKAEPAKKAASKQPATQAPSGTGKTKVNWHALAQEIPVVHADAATSPEDYKAIIKKVLSDSKVRSFSDQLANHGGPLPILAMAIKAAAPKLSPSDARVSSLSRALRFALAGTQYALARESDDVQPVLVRRSSKPAGMLPDLSLDDIQRGVQ